MEMKAICQSCAMPLESPEMYGTNRDESPNEEYCKYCYQNGAFTKEETMEEMIETCIPFMTEPGSGFTEETARQLMRQTLPQLKRWKKA